MTDHSGTPGADLVRRWHRPQRHSRAREAAQRASRPGAGPGRGPLPRRGARVSRPPGGTRLQAAVRASPARVLVEGVPDAADARHVPVRARGALRARRGRLRGELRRRPRGCLPAALLRPALEPGREGRCGGHRRAELRHDRPGAHPGPALPRGEVHARRPRRARRLRLAGSPDEGPDLPAYAPPGPGVVGGADPKDRRRARGRSRPTAC